MDRLLNKRVDYDGNKGTIKWIGELPAVQGIRYGVDWDDQERGKHNGSYNGIQKFKTSKETSGSFVKPDKVKLGINLEEGVRGRYQDDTTIEEEVTSELKRSINARFVEVVGMEKIGKKQSQLESLETVVLDGWLINGAGEPDLKSLLPRVHHLDISNTLISSWEEIAKITRQLQSLRTLNVSGNRIPVLENPEKLVDSTSHLTHVIMNHMGTYSWEDLMTCFELFPNVQKVQVAFNNLEYLGRVPSSVFQFLEDIDVGANPIEDFAEICHLGPLKRLKFMNLCHCKLTSIAFPETPVDQKSDRFIHLQALMLANNTLNYWDSISELNKLQSLYELSLSHDAVDGLGNYFMEFTLARLSKLKTLNRTTVSSREKRDFQLYYLRTFSNDYYNSGGKENPAESLLSEEFVMKHPSFLALVKDLGSPPDDRNSSSKKSQKIRDLKMELTIVAPDKEEVSDVTKSFMPGTKLSKFKMMVKRILKLSGNTTILLSHVSAKVNFEIEMQSDNGDLQFYSIENGDKIYVRW